MRSFSSIESKITPIVLSFALVAGGCGKPETPPPPPPQQSNSGAKTENRIVIPNSGPSGGQTTIVVEEKQATAAEACVRGGAVGGGALALGTVALVVVDCILTMCAGTAIIGATAIAAAPKAVAGGCAIGVMENAIPPAGSKEIRVIQEPAAPAEVPKEDIKESPASLPQWLQAPDLSRA